MTSRHYVFIVGCQRSGTTLLGQIMGAHPQAVLIDENHGVYSLIETILSDAGDEELALQQCLAKAHQMYVERSRFAHPTPISPRSARLVYPESTMIR